MEQIFGYLLDYQWLQNIWHEKNVMTLIQSVIFSLIFLTCNTAILFGFWYLTRETILEYGSPKRRKKIAKKMQSYSFWNHFFLVRLVSDSERSGIYLMVKLLFYWLSLIAYAVSVLGVVGTIATQGSGKAIALLIFPVFSVFLVSTVVSFLPDFLCLPSERKRYSLK